MFGIIAGVVVALAFFGGFYIQAEHNPWTERVRLSRAIESHRAYRGTLISKNFEGNYLLLSMTTPYEGNANVFVRFQTEEGTELVRRDAAYDAGHIRAFTDEAVMQNIPAGTPVTVFANETGSPLIARRVIFTPTQP